MNAGWKHILMQMGATERRSPIGLTILDLLFWLLAGFIVIGAIDLLVPR